MCYVHLLCHLLQKICKLFPQFTQLTPYELHFSWMFSPLRTFVCFLFLAISMLRSLFPLVFVLCFWAPSLREDPLLLALSVCVLSIILLTSYPWGIIIHTRCHSLVFTTFHFICNSRLVSLIGEATSLTLRSPYSKEKSNFCVIKNNFLSEEKNLVSCFFSFKHFESSKAIIHFKGIYSLSRFVCMCLCVCVWIFIVLFNRH